MFDEAGHCLFARGELEQRFAHWTVLHSSLDDFGAPGRRTKSFATLVARKPLTETGTADHP